MPDKRKVIKEWESVLNRDPLDSPWDLIDDTLILLKEHDAIEPRVSSVEQRCGNCNKVIDMDGWKACPWCGKLIDWEGWWSKNGRNRKDFNGNQVDPRR